MIRYASFTLVSLAVICRWRGEIGRYREICFSPPATAARER
jgi:hypothetical protein